jgi:UDP-glucose 4-epimerase
LGSVATDALQFSGQSRPGDPFSLVANANRLSKLGFTWQIPLDEGMAAYVRWYQGQQGGAQ